MKRVRRAWSRLVAVFARRDDAALADEIEAHLQMQTEDNVRRGMTPGEARRQAVLKFGGVESTKERYRDQRGLPALESVGRDARHALRVMRRTPGLTAAIVLSLGLAVAATSAIFSVADAVLLRSLPYREPSRLATIAIDGAITAPLFETFRRESRAIEQAGLFDAFTFNLSGVGEPVRIPGARVSPEVFSLVGVAPQLGRWFTRAEDRPGGESVVIIGDALWRTRFGGDRGAVGRRIVVNGVPHTIVGVMPPGFAFPNGPELPATVGAFPPAQIWRPMALSDEERACAGCFNFAMLARVRPGFTANQARADLDGLLGRVRHRTGPGVTVRTLDDAVTGRVRLPIRILFGAVVIALLISCLNVANLLLARGLRRQAEVALRMSLGATRGRVVRQLLTEAVILSLAAAAAAVPMAWVATRVLVAIAPSGIPRLDAVTLDGRVLAFTLAISVLSALVFGAAPAFLTARHKPVEVLNESAGRATAARSVALRVLAVAEFGLSLVLLVAAALLARSYLAVAETPLGFRAENVLTLRTSLPDAKYDEERRAALVERIVAACASLPGVRASAAVSTLPLTGESEGWGVQAEENPSLDAYTMARARAVTPGYFRAMGIRMLFGRDFDDRDRSQRVAIVSDTAARRLWPGVTNAVGHRLRSKSPITIVGVVTDTRASGLDTEVRPYLYVPFWLFAPESFALAIRFDHGDVAALVPAVKSEIWRVDKDQPVTHVETMSEVVADSIGGRRFQFVLMTTFSVFALALAAIGIFGVLSYTVAQRTREIGIRMALGASRARVVRAVMVQAGALAASGAAVGAVAAWLLMPVLRSLLYGVTAFDLPVFTGAVLVLLAVAGMAALMPAWRAATMLPGACLRGE
jgi:putative ABC transport system permease protein